jgi:chromosome segregation protein
VFLKSLEIFGFKSFAERTCIEFSEGISALLGPNGCGKSNVVDAIKWVVGEQSPKSLRADSMEDIIFNGTEKRKALSVAEVTLTICNENGRLPLDMPEIAIKRRLYRSGEGEYFINGVQTRLKEIRELFWDTGIGKSAYSVMEQGKIDQILSSKPEDRRYLFEEAAGITKHKVRSREAELKLEHTEENMRQAGGILGEIKRSHDALKQQSEQTRLYRSLRDDIFEAELDLHLLRLRQFVQERERRDADLKARTQARTALRSEIDSLDEELRESFDVVDGMETSLVEIQKTVYGLAVERNGKEKQRKLLDAKVAEARIKIDQASLRHKTVGDKVDSLREEEDEKNGELASLRLRLRDVEKNVHGFEEGIHSAESTLKSNEKAIIRAESEIRDFEAGRGKARLKLDAITENIVEELDARLKDSGYSGQERVAAEGIIDGLIATIRARLAGKASFMDDLARAAGTSFADMHGILEKIGKDLEGTAALADELALRYEKYKRTTPSFIDEFLSPEGIITLKRAIDRELSACEEGVFARRERIAALMEENRILSAQVEGYRKTLEELRGNRIRMQTQGVAAEESLAVFRREIAGQEAFLRELENEVHLGEKKLADSREELQTLDGEIVEIEIEGRSLSAKLEILEHDIASRNADLGKRREELARKTERMGAIQVDIERLHLGLAQVETEIRNVKENFSEQYSRDLREYERRMFEIRTPVTELKDRLTSFRQKLKDLGSVNLMAPEEYAEIKERYDFLSGQMADLEKARQDLRRVTDEIRAESAELFLATYNRIKKNFHNMFRRLFGGGRGELRLVDPDHVLESGIEIFAQPPGKKLEAISLLSGGEKTLTAIAILFATYMVKPSPFCFLDEIDAALDEANVSRFVDLLREFGRTSQFVIITHNKKTVTGAGTLLGVTMEESGVTKAIAVKLERAGEGVESMRSADQVWEEEEVIYEKGRELPPVHTAAGLSAS